jgi:hypothetical protein
VRKGAAVIEDGRERGRGGGDGRLDGTGGQSRTRLFLGPERALVAQRFGQFHLVERPLDVQLFQRFQRHECGDEA